MIFLFRLHRRYERHLRAPPDSWIVARLDTSAIMVVCCSPTWVITLKQFNWDTPALYPELHQL